MKAKTYSLHILFLLLGLFSVGLNRAQAQVTIGSSLKPADGAILDLKQEGTTKKGLMLPRVNLIHLAIPNNGTDLSLTIDNAQNTPWNKDIHTGLMVYHAGKYDQCDPNTFPQGIYVWDSNRWQILGESDKQHSEVKIEIDPRDGESYLYRKFGDAGEWMLENMRYIDPAMTPGTGAAINYAYPNANISTPGVKPASWNYQQGLLYSFTAATIGADPSLEEGSRGQGEADEDVNAHIQGVCPDGWHVPSDREWNRLEKEIYNNAPKYSHHTAENGFPFTPAEWNPLWEETDFESDLNLAIGPRGAETDQEALNGGHGKAMLSICPSLTIDNNGNSTSGPATKGESFLPKKGGFNALPVGAIAGGELMKDPDGIDSYGNAVLFWTSSPINSEEIGIQGRYFRLIPLLGYDGGNPQVVTRLISIIENHSMLSVRCTR